MSRLRRFLTLPPRDRRLLVLTAVLLAAVELALAVLPLRRVRRVIDIVLRARDGAPDHDAVDRVRWAVRTAAANLPGAVGCLPRALVGEALLRRAGLDPSVTVGVRKADDGGLRAHGWVELDGEPVVGAVEPEAGFARLGPLERR